jgi:hypothetical protein
MTEGKRPHSVKNADADARKKHRPYAEGDATHSGAYLPALGMGILPLFYTVPPPRQYPIFAIFVTNLCYTQELIPQPRRRYTPAEPRCPHPPSDGLSPDDGERSAPNNTAAVPPHLHCPCPHTPATSPPAPVSTQAPRPPPRHRHTGFNRTSNPSPSRRHRCKSSRKPASGQRSHTTGM